MRSQRAVFLAVAGLLALFTVIAIVGVIGDASSSAGNAPRWGPASEWFAGWATAVALVIGIAAFLTQLRDRAADEEADAHEQQAEADQVVVRLGTLTEAGDDEPTWVVAFDVWNYSERPIKRVSVRSNVQDEPCPVAGSLQPEERAGGQLVLPRAAGRAQPGGGHPALEVLFTDWLRTRWRRPEHGDAIRVE